MLSQVSNIFSTNNALDRESFVLRKLIKIALGLLLPTSHHVRKFACSLNFILIEYTIYCPDFTDKDSGKERLSNLCYLLQVRNAKLRDELMQNGSNNLP